MPGITSAMASHVGLRREERADPSRSTLLDRINALLPEGVRPVSYRRFDIWLRRGWITIANPTPGSGGRRTLTDAELWSVVAVATELQRLDDAMGEITSGAFFRRQVELRGGA